MVDCRSFLVNCGVGGTRQTRLPEDERITATPLDCGARPDGEDEEEVSEKLNGGTAKAQDDEEERDGVLTAMSSSPETSMTGCRSEDEIEDEDNEEEEEEEEATVEE